MADSDAPVVQLGDMVPGQKADFYALLAERQRSVTRDGKPYFTCRFRDSTRMATFMVWADSPHFAACEKEWREGQFFKIRAIYQQHIQFGPQIDVQKIRPVNDGDRALGFEPLHFVECSRFDPQEMYKELCAIAQEHIADAGLQTLVLTILTTYEEPLKSSPATQRHYYPFHGGLLEHTLSVAKNCLFLAEKYRAHYPDLKPPLNKDLLVAGGILHDIGRLFVYDDQIVKLEPTIPGRLLGHVVLGRDLVRDTAREVGSVDPELVHLLEHLLLSHSNHPEWGSQRNPFLPECILLQHAVELDTMMEMYVRCLKGDAEEGLFTARDPVLARQLLKGRKV